MLSPAQRSTWNGIAGEYRAAEAIVSFNLSPSLPTAQTVAPCFASPIAIAWPIPLLAPVTRATEFDKGPASALVAPASVATIGVMEVVFIIILESVWC
jgi:hypothetical protein